jgi:hypothetical protein
MNTAQDVVDYLLTSTGGGAQDGEHRAVRSAVVHGVREVFQTRDWLWHTTEGTFTTQQISTTATVTSGSATIVVANATGFVPGRIVALGGTSLFSLTPRIQSVSGNNVTLDRPAIGSGTGVTVLVQTFYDLPLNVKDIDSLITETVGTLYCYISPQEWQQLQINTRGAGEPYYYTIMRSDTDPQRFQVRFVGVPTNGTVVYYTYRYTPGPIRLMGYEASCRTGTATVASPNFTTVTLTGSTLPPDLTGAAIRFGTATAEADPVGSLTPFVYERRIVSRVNDTSLTVDSALPAMATVKYAISDVIDASQTMYTAVLSAAEMWYARLVGKDAGQATQLFNRDLRLALENDVISPQSGRVRRQYPTPRTMGYYSPILPDVG